MKKFRLFIIMMVYPFVIAGQCVPIPVQVVSAITIGAFEIGLAERWAPIHHQDVHNAGGHGRGGRSDFITAVDYDGEFDMSNNWNNINSHPLTAHAYYSVVWTSTHWFIVYAFYHPRDWNTLPGCFDEHENDMEGLLVIVERPASFSAGDFGQLRGIVTVAHNDFFSYTPSGSPLTDGNENIDGRVRMELFRGNPHPVTAQQAEGHGLKAEPHYRIRGGDGIIYLPQGLAQEPSHNNDRSVSYKLVDIFESGGLFERSGNSETFASPGTFNGDDCGDDQADAPWGWDDHNDNPGRGTLATDPASLVQDYFNGLGNFSTTFTRNLYTGVTCSGIDTC